MSVLLNHSQRPPSYANGFARCAGESAYPELWKGLVGAWVPTMGNTGKVLRDVSGHGMDGPIIGTQTWVQSKHGPAIYSPGNTKGIETKTLKFGSGHPWTVYFWFAWEHNGASYWVPYAWQDNESTNYPGFDTWGQNNSSPTYGWGFDLSMGLSAGVYYFQDTSGRRYNPGETNLVVYTYDGNRASRYVNGAFHERSAYDYAIAAATSKFTLFNNDSATGANYAGDQNTFKGNFYGALLYDCYQPAGTIARLSKDLLAPFRLRSVYAGSAAAILNSRRRRSLIAWSQ